MSQRADQWGIQTEYLNAFGKPQAADPETVARMIDILSQGGAHSPGILPPTCIVRDGRGRRVQVDAPEQQEIVWSISCERPLFSGSARAPWSRSTSSART